MQGVNPVRLFRRKVKVNPVATPEERWREAAPDLHWNHRSTEHPMVVVDPNRTQLLPTLEAPVYRPRVPYRALHSIGEDWC